MMSNLKILILSCVALGSAHLVAMEQAPSRVPTLYQLTLNELSKQDDVDILRAALSALPDEFAWDLLREVIKSNFGIGAVGQSALLEDFLSRPNLSGPHRELLEALEKKLLSRELRSEDVSIILQEIQIKSSGIAAQSVEREPELKRSRLDPEGYL